MSANKEMEIKTYNLDDVLNNHEHFLNMLNDLKGEQKINIQNIV